MRKLEHKLNTRIKINICIFVAVALLFAIVPKIMFGIWYPRNVEDNQPQYEGGFSYILYDICPCPADDDSCSGYYACGPDKANITYNLDTAPKELLDEAKRMHYLDGMINSARLSPVVMRQYLLCDICYLMAFVSLVSGIIYWNHAKART